MLLLILTKKLRKFNRFKKQKKKKVLGRNYLEVIKKIEEKIMI